jgi:hypothetical protein
MTTATTHPEPSNKRIVLSILIGVLLAGCLALAPILALASGMVLFRFVPSDFEFFGLVPRPGVLPVWAIGILISLAAFSLEGIIFLPVWIVTRKRESWKILHAASGGLLLAAAYLLVWALAGLPFPDQSVFPALIRLGAALIGLGLIFRPLRQQAPAGWKKGSVSSILLAIGAGLILLVPWIVLGALGTIGQTAASLATALSYGVGEELLLRGIIAALIARATGRPRLGFLMGFLVGLALQPGYLLPLGDVFSIFRLFNAVAVGILATELAARGSLLGAIIVHAAFEFGYPAWVDWRMEFSLPHPAALESIGLAILLAGIFVVIRFVSNGNAKTRLLRLRLPVAAAFAVLALAGSAVEYAANGHPGFTQDGFLIVFREQADLSGVQSISGRTQRIAFLYKNLVDTAERVQAPARAELDRLGVSYRPHYLINLIDVRGRTDLMSAFAARPEVQTVLLNPNVRMVNYAETMEIYALPPSTQGVEWNIQAVGAPAVWAQGVDGGGIVVAGADTGVDWTHPALQSQYRGWSNGTASHDYNWYDPWDGTAAPWDDHGHGTYTLGTVVGRDGTDNQIGMAPGAQWIACRNMRYGIGNPGAYLSCLEFFLAPFPIHGDPFHDGRPELAPHIVNNSWGCPAREGCGAATLAPAFTVLHAAGIMMVAAGGNDGPACGTVSDPPANSGDVFTVGASEQSGGLAFFSSRGPAGGILKPEIAAPGDLVRSCIPGGKYTISSGTSIASPHVAGAAALLWSAFPELIGDIDRTVEILERTARPVTAAQICPVLTGDDAPCLCGSDSQTGIPNNSFGYGVLDVYAAYQELGAQQ